MRYPPSTGITTPFTYAPARDGLKGDCRTPRFRRARLAINELDGLELALLDLLRQLDSANGNHCVVESLEPEHRPSPLFDSPVVLFNEVVQVLLDRIITLLESSPVSFISRTARCDAA
jgi:hypothetical protein